jgi:hypothetical protein
LFVRRRHIMAGLFFAERTALRRGRHGRVSTECGHKMESERPERKGFYCFYYCASLSRAASCRLSMDESNLNFWGEIAVPVGVAICFGVALLVWLREEFRAGSDPTREK